MSTVTQSIIIDRKLLAGAVSRIAGLADGRYKPILRYLRLRDCDLGMTLAATNLECYAEIGILPERAEPTGADLLLPAKELHQILALCDGPTVEIEQTDSGIRITSERARWTLATENPEQFPTPPEVATDKSATVSTTALRHALSVCGEFTADHKQYALAGVRIEGDGRSLIAVGSDGSNMAVVEFPSLGNPGEAVLSGESVRHVLRLLPDDGDATIAIDKSNFEVTCGQTKVIGRQIEGRYPQWRNVGVLETGKDCQFEVHAPIFTAAIQRAAVVESDRARGMNIEVADGMARFTCRNADAAGASESELPIASDSRMAIRVRPWALLSFLRFCGDQAIEVSLEKSRCARIVCNGARFMSMDMDPTKA